MYGISGKLNDWVASYLSNRKQRVVLGDVFSDWVSVISGVPQGSVLGPILFIIYINDLPEFIANITKLYADDSKILVFYDSIFAKQYDLDQFAKWFEIWSIKMNIKKCKVMLIGKHNKRFTYNHQTELATN
jgi:hypothetical protein